MRYNFKTVCKKKRHGSRKVESQMSRATALKVEEDRLKYRAPMLLFSQRSIGRYREICESKKKAEVAVVKGNQVNRRRQFVAKAGPVFESSDWFNGGVLLPRLAKNSKFFLWNLTRLFYLLVRQWTIWTYWRVIWKGVKGSSLDMQKRRKNFDKGRWQMM